MVPTIEGCFLNEGCIAVNFSTSFAVVGGRKLNISAGTAESSSSATLKRSTISRSYREVLPESSLPFQRCSIAFRARTYVLTLCQVTNPTYTYPDRGRRSNLHCCSSMTALQNRQPVDRELLRFLQLCFLGFLVHQQSLIRHRRAHRLRTDAACGQRESASEGIARSPRRRSTRISRLRPVSKNIPAQQLQICTCRLWQRFQSGKSG